MGHIFLYGPPASGISTIGRTLAENLNLTIVDLDDRIKQTSGMEIPKLMVEQGEAVFRDLEAAELEKLKGESDSVVALGGGTLLLDKNREFAESYGLIIYLDADIQTLLKHLAGDNSSRPLLAGDTIKKLETLLTSRASHYDSFRTRISVDGMTPEQIAWQIQVILGQFYLRSMGAGYRAIIRSGSMDSIGEILRAQGSTNPIVITDVNVAKLYGEKIIGSLRRSEYKPNLIPLPAGESFKTLDSINRIWKSFLEAGLDRASTVVALGGGVVGDLTGFAAATFMRGIDWVCIPSTLLSMVDASLGGKTGIDLPEGKNLIGNFHPPRLVLADPQMLATLPLEELRSGMAEVVKHGIIADPDLFNLCSHGFEAALKDLPQIVQRAMAVKIKIIEEDPYEKGSRAALNLGHTLGHALESISGYHLRHGEAVAIGMVMEARLAENLKIADKRLSAKIAEILSSLGLPIQIPKDLSKEQLINSMQYDKKKNAGVVRFALPVEIGKVCVNVEVKDLELMFKEN